MAETIRETVEQWIKEQDDSDLLDFAREFDNIDELTWAYKVPTDEVLFMRVESVNGDVDALWDIVRWAKTLGDTEYLDFEWEPYDEDEVLGDIKKYHLDELADKVVDGIDYLGVPDIYDSIDTDELYELLKKCPEWVEKYGDEN